MGVYHYDNGGVSVREYINYLFYGIAKLYKVNNVMELFRYISELSFY